MKINKNHEYLYVSEFNSVMNTDLIKCIKLHKLTQYLPQKQP